MQTAASTLAILRVLNARRGTDLVDVFVPLVMRLVADNSLTPIGKSEVAHLCELFFAEYGVRVPQYAMSEILNRARKRGYLKKENHQFLFVPDSFSSDLLTAVSDTQRKRVGRVVTEIAVFSARELDDPIEEVEAQDALLSFISSSGADFLISAQRHEPLVVTTENKADEYRVARFIQYAYEHDYETYLGMVDMSLGYFIAAAIAEPPAYLTPFRAGLGGNHVYLDTPLVLDLIGSHGPESAAAMREFITVLKGHEVRLHVFEHNVNEVSNILADCASKLALPDLDTSRLSPACSYYHQAGVPADEVAYLLENLESRLAEYSLQIAETPDPNEDRRYEIDVVKLEDLILKTYAEGREGFVAGHRVQTQVRTDVESIRAVYKLRGSLVPMSVRKAKYLLVTDNTRLAKADRRFARGEMQYAHAVSAVQTADTLCTILWLQSPSETEALNAKRLIADAYAVVEPDDRLVDLFVQEVARRLEVGEISEEESYVLRSSSAARDLLLDATLNDPERFTRRTADEVLNDLIRSKNSETRNALAKKEAEAVALRKTIVEKNDEIDRANQRVVEVETGIRTWSKGIASAVGIVVFLLAAAWLIYGAWVSKTDSAPHGWARLAADSYYWGAVVILLIGGSTVLVRDKIVDLLHVRICSALGVEPLGRF